MVQDFDNGVGDAKQNAMVLSAEDDNAERYETWLPFSHTAACADSNALAKTVTALLTQEKVRLQNTLNKTEIEMSGCGKSKKKMATCFCSFSFTKEIEFPAFCKAAATAKGFLRVQQAGYGSPSILVVLLL